MKGLRTGGGWAAGLGVCLLMIGGCGQVAEAPGPATATPPSVTETVAPPSSPLPPTATATHARATLTATLVPATATPAPPMATGASEAGVAGAEATPTGVQAESGLHYFWPTTLPLEMEVQREGAEAGPEGFVLEVAAPGTQWYATITGGPGSIAASAPRSNFGREPITVRGQPGIVFGTGGGFSIFWEEDGQPYAVLGGLGRDDTLAVATALEALDLATWQTRLEAVGE